MSILERLFGMGGNNNQQAPQPAPQQQAAQPMGQARTGTGMFGIDFSDPQKAAALQMISNGLTPSVGTPRPMFQGVQAATANAMGMQETRLKREKEAKALEEESMLKSRSLGWIQDNAPEYMPLVEAGLFSASDVAKKVMGGNEDEFAKRERIGIESGLQGPELQAFKLNGKYEPGAGGPDMKVETDLRKEYSGLDDTKNYTKVRDAYERVRASATRAQTDATGASDMAIVFNYMKMLDPGSTVREGEFQSAAESGGYGPRIQNIVSNITAGKILTNAQRQEFVDTAAKLYDESLGNLGAQNERYTGIAEANQVEPGRVIMQGEQYEPLQLGETRAIGDGSITIKRVSE